MRRLLSDLRRHLRKSALTLVGLLVAAYAVLRLVPTLEQALRSLEHVSWEWVLGAIALEVMSELGFVLAWGAIVDPQKRLDRDGRGRLTDDEVAWTQLAGGLVLPGGAWGGVGVGALILHRLEVPSKLIGEREFTLSFLNTAIDALALIVFGVGLATGALAGEQRLLLTLLPAAVAATGIVAAWLVARRASRHGERRRAKHPKIASAITTLAQAVDDTEQLLFQPWQLDERARCGGLPRIRRPRPVDCVPRHRCPSSPGVRDRAHGVHHRCPCRIDSPTGQPRDDRWYGRDADPLRRGSQHRDRRGPAARGDRAARAAHRRWDRLRDPSPPCRADHHCSGQPCSGGPRSTIDRRRTLTGPLATASLPSATEPATGSDSQARAPGQGIDGRDRRSESGILIPLPSRSREGLLWPCSPNHGGQHDRYRSDQSNLGRVPRARE